MENENLYPTKDELSNAILKLLNNDTLIIYLGEDNNFSISIKNNDEKLFVIIKDKKNNKHITGDCISNFIKLTPISIR